MTNYYQVLQVSKQASEDAIRKAYRKLAKQCHPDMYPGDMEKEAQFKELSEAYGVLSDPQKRKEYDEKLKKARGDRGSGSQSQASAADFVDFENIQKSFEKFFGFNPDTKEVVNEDKLNPKAKNPLDATDMFEKFMGIKR